MVIAQYGAAVVGFCVNWIDSASANGVLELVAAAGVSRQFHSRKKAELPAHVGVVPSEQL